MVSPVTLSSYEQKDNEGIVTTSDNQRFSGKMIVGADGAHSWLRAQCQIAVKKVDYEQRGIVATVKTSMPHQQTARQLFLKEGPLAFLPLSDPQTCSIVWSVPLDQAAALLEIDDVSFKKTLTNAFQHRLGEVIETGQRFAFPLYQQQAANYVQDRIALVGDAAHVMHPLAGQGVNTGLLDAARLADVVVDAIKNNRSFSSLPTLRRYERWSRADNQLMLKGIDTIKNVFANPSPAANRLLNLGLTLTNNVSVLKNIFIRHAVGKREGLPLLAK
jgi:2-octaprenylphenol hydroxylase